MKKNQKYFEDELVIKYAEKNDEYRNHANNRVNRPASKDRRGEPLTPDSTI